MSDIILRLDPQEIIIREDNPEIKLDNFGDIYTNPKHSTLDELLWSEAGHTIDTTLPLNNNLLTGINNAQYNTSYTVTGSEPIGSTYWNQDDLTWDFRLTSEVTGQLFHEDFFNVKNQTGETLSDPTPVMFAGTVGASGRLLIQKAIADDSIPPEYMIGALTETLINGGDGKANTRGQVRGVDTTGAPYGEVWSENDIIYVSPTTAGYLTNVEPSAPDRRIVVGVVINKHATQGSLGVRPSWSPKFTELDDINGTPLTVSGQIPVWDNSNKYFDFDYNINDYIFYDFVPASVTLTAGTLISGTVTDVQKMYDGNEYQVQELAATPGYDIRFNFTNVTRTPRFVVCRWRYDGSATHFCTVDIYNYTTTNWDQVRKYVDSSAYFDSMTMMIPIANNGDYVDGSGNAMIRFYHHVSGNASHDIHIDYVGLSHHL